MILDLKNKEVEKEFIKRLDLLVYEVGTGRKKFLELKAGEDKLQLIPSLKNGEIKFIVAINQEFTVEKGDLRAEKYWYKIVKNIYAKNKRPQLKKAFIKNWGKVEGLKRYDEQIEKSSIVLYSSIYPSTKALVQKLKKVDNLEIMEDLYGE